MNNFSVADKHIFIDLKHFEKNAYGSQKHSIEILLKQN